VGEAARGMRSGSRFIQLEVLTPSGCGNNATAIKRTLSLSGTAFIELASAAILLSGVSWITRFIYVFGFQFEAHGLGI